MKAKGCLHSMTCDQLDEEGNMCHYGGMTGWGGGRSQMIGRAFSAEK